MKSLILTSLLIISSLIASDSKPNRLEQQEKKASAYIKIYSKHEGKPGYPRENWYAENKSKDQAIKITVVYWNGNYASADKRTKIFDLEPGEKKGIGTKRSGTSETTYAKLKGSRFKR